MKTLIAIPCGDMCNTDFLRSLLSMEIVGEVQFTFAQGSLIYDARNKLAGVAMDGEFDRVLWLDSDMVFPSDLMKQLSADLDDGAEMVTGVYTTRKPPFYPTVYSKLWYEQKPGEKWNTPRWESVKELPEEPFEVAGCGFGAVMMSVSMLRRVYERFGLPFSPAAGFGEDLSFCLRATELGVKIVCDPRPKLGHVGLRLYTVNDIQGGQT